MTLAPMNAATPSAPSAPIHTAPPQAGRVLLGRTLPSLLDEACTNNPNPKALNEATPAGWRTLSSQEFKRQAEALALGLLSLPLAPGARVAFYTHSDLSFCLPDMACLIAGLVSVPLYLTHSDEAIRFILEDTEAEAVVVSDEGLLARLAPLLVGSSVRTLILGSGEAAGAGGRVTFAELAARGEAERARDPEALRRLREAAQASDVATIIYTSGTTGTPKGVMLTHENISANALAACSGLTGFKRGEEVALSYLPLTHVFARTLHYGYLAWGAAVYFTTPEQLAARFKELQPTVFATVPRVLERVYERIVSAGSELTGVKRRVFDWSLALARRFDPEKDRSGLYGTQLRAADKLVYERWREALGGRLKLAIVGGAALRPELVRVFGAAGVDVLQGYGLTETSPVIAYNRPERNRPGTVGQLLAGAQVKLSRAGEILTRGPYVMKGYYNNPTETAAVMEDGWLRTGDLGEMSADGFLSVTGRLKSMFKLSTGEYVMPTPLELLLEDSPVLEHALVVGEGQKYAAALLFVPPATDPADPKLHEELRALLRAVNKRFPAASQVKRALLLADPLTTDNGFLTPTLKLKRGAVLTHYAAHVSALFPGAREVHSPNPPQAALPAGSILELEER